MSIFFVCCYSDHGEDDDEEDDDIKKSKAELLPMESTNINEMNVDYSKYDISTSTSQHQHTANTKMNINNYQRNTSSTPILSPSYNQSLQTINITNNEETMETKS